MTVNQKGYTLIEIVILVVVITSIGAISFLAFSNYKDSREKSNSSGAPAPTPSISAEAQADFKKSDNSYLTIEEWGVRIPVTGNLTSLKLDKPSSTAYSSEDRAVTIITPSLDQSWTCEPVDGHKGTIGSIVRTSLDKRSGPYEPAAVKIADPYTYSFENGGGNCSSDPDYDRLVKAFSAAFNNLESY